MRLASIENRDRTPGIGSGVDGSRRCRLYAGRGSVIVWMPSEHPLAQRWVDERGERFTIDQWRTFRVHGLLGDIEERRTTGWTPVTTELEPAIDEDPRLKSSVNALGASLANVVHGINSGSAQQYRRRTR